MKINPCCPKPMKKELKQVQVQKEAVAPKQLSHDTVSFTHKSK